jgi:hypothetical protein
MQDDTTRELLRALAAARSALETIKYELRGRATRDEALAHDLATQGLEASKADI